MAQVKRLDVVAGILWRDGEYLAVQRPPGSRMEGWWEFPGGQIESGEQPGEALVRELREELGVTATEFAHWRNVEHVYPELAVHLRFFHVTGFEGEPQGLEGQAMQWCDPARPPKLEFLEADLPIVAALKDFEK